MNNEKWTLKYEEWGMKWPFSFIVASTNCGRQLTQTFKQTDTDTATDTLTFLCPIPASCHPVCSLQPCSVRYHCKLKAMDWRMVRDPHSKMDWWLHHSGRTLVVAPSPVSVTTLFGGQSRLIMRCLGSCMWIYSTFKSAIIHQALKTEACLLKGICEEIISSD